MLGLFYNKEMNNSKVYKYKLPLNGQTEYSTSNNSLIIIGANGSGKSKLGAWIEQQDMENVHRIGAQRSLNFGDFIELKSREQAENSLLYGVDNIENNNSYRKKLVRWDYGEFTTKLLNDYRDVLSLMIAIKNQIHDKYIKECKEKEKNKQEYDKVPDTVIDKLIRIWNNIFPQREIDFTDAKVTTKLKNAVGDIISYKGKEMSDGERVALYLIAQCLCIPENKTIIIDEPEIHLHRSIMNKLWTEIEKERKDCFFIYITHDTQFAANHKNADKVWVKEYDGENWKIEKIEQNNGLPEQLLLDIMGSRKKVLFVEGTAESYDTQLYSVIYKDYYVIPCGGCSSVINFTKAMKDNAQLHHLECYGLIDRDYRTEEEIESLKAKGIYTIDVAEVENLFLVEELLLVINDILSPGDSKVENIKNKIIERYQSQKDTQICNAIITELKHKLSTIDINKKGEEKVKEALEEGFRSIFFDSIKEEKQNIFDLSTEYKEILKLFNQKRVSHIVKENFGIKKDYEQFVIGQLQGDKSENIIEAIKKYLPNEIKI